MQDETRFFGADVAKAELVAAAAPIGVQLSVRNDRASTGHWLRTLAPGSFIAWSRPGAITSCWPKWRSMRACTCTCSMPVMFMSTAPTC